MSTRSTVPPASLRPFYLCLGVLIAIWLIEFGLYFSYEHHLIPVRMLTPFFPSDLRFTDLTIFIPRAEHFGEPHMLSRPDLGIGYTYPLPSFFVYLLFVRHTIPLYLTVCVVAFTGVTALFAVHMWRRTASAAVQVLIWSTFFLLFPMYFLIDRGNIEVVLWLFTVTGIWLVFRKRLMAAAVFLSVAASMKMYPALFFLLFLKRGSKRAVALGIALTGVFTLAAYKIIGPTIRDAMRDTAPGAQWTMRAQLNPLNPPILRFDHSLFSLLRRTHYMYHHIVFHRPYWEFAYKPWVIPFAVLALIGFAALYWLRIRHLPLINQVICLILTAVLLPFFSYDYTLVYLGIVYACLLLYAVQKGTPQPSMLAGRTGTITAVLLAISMSPIINLAGRYYGGQAKSLCLIGLFVLALRHPMALPEYDQGMPA